MSLNCRESKTKNKGSAFTSLKETEQLLFNIIMKLERNLMILMAPGQNWVLTGSKTIPEHADN